MRGHSLILLCIALCSGRNLLAAPSENAEWPQLLGPSRNAVYAGPPLLEQWPADGPKVLWNKPVGEGYSNPIFGEGRLVICHRMDTNLMVECLDPKTGTSFWNFKHGMKFQDGAYFDSGPRPTPCIGTGRLFVHNTDGYLVCLNLENGKKVWSKNVKAQFKSSATWHGCVSSPLLTEKALILQVGGSNASVVAFAPTTGEVLWQALDDKSSASSPILAKLAGKEQILIATRSALRSLDPDTGKENWSVATRKQSTGNVYCASPVVFDDKILVSGWYNLGALLLQAKDGKPETLWHLDNAISTHYANPIVYEGYIYGYHGHAWERGGPNLRCVELATGKVMWEQPQTGSGTIIRSGDNLLILSDTGELLLAKANPKEFRVKSRAQIVGRTTRSYPAIVDGLAYIKGPKKLVALDLRAQK
ncbi:MAG TPA: PQQ-binding-like beta-propeller repeat protein [Patescibacteria group bacterium]|nr:PQQ-binding-like beta-propeller repeat protein [Patescibacteria group bacterium]